MSLTNRPLPEEFDPAKIAGGIPEPERFDDAPEIDEVPLDNFALDDLVTEWLNMGVDQFSPQISQLMAEGGEAEFLEALVESARDYFSTMIYEGEGSEAGGRHPGLDHRGRP